MAQGARILGQETTLNVSFDGTDQTRVFAAVKSMSFEFKTELKEEGFLGETTQRYDSVFNGISGDIELQMEGPEALQFADLLANKAQRRGGLSTATRCDIVTSMNFPLGRRARVLIPDVEFGPVPYNNGSRTDYLTMKLSFGASQARVLAV